MSPIIRIPEPVYDKLQSFAAPFIDTPASVIERLIDYYEINKNNGSSNSTGKNIINQRSDKIRTYDPENPPNLLHTRIIKANVGGSSAYNWNNLVHATHREVMETPGSFDELSQISISNIIKGKYTYSGYLYYKDMDISIQGVNANTAWKHALELAQKSEINIKVIFQWRKNKGASNPGGKGILEWRKNSINGKE